MKGSVQTQTSPAAIAEVGASRLARQSRLRKVLFWGAMLAAAGAPRVLAAIVLPNEEGDPYSYLQAIESMRASILSGSFTLSDVFGFWLPMYQFICALISVVTGHPLLVAKLVAAVCGAGTCVFVYRLTLLLTGRRGISLLAFALIAANPLHILYSAFSMTDVPYALLILSSLYFASRGRWRLAALLVAVACLVRVEAWMFVLLLPALQFRAERRISPAVVSLTLVSPLLWLYISWAATGNPLEYFRVRNGYVADVFAAHPELARFSLSGAAANLSVLLYSINPVVILASLGAIWLILKRMRHRAAAAARPGHDSALLLTCAYWVFSLSFLLAAYFTHNQPDIWARYGLIIFALGIPVTAWALLSIRRLPPRAAQAAFAVIGAVFSLQWAAQFGSGLQFVSQTAQKRAVAEYLRAAAWINADVKVLCDDHTVRILSKLPEERFLDSTALSADSGEVLRSLEENGVGCLVSINTDAPPVSPFSELDDLAARRMVQPVLTTGSSDYSIRLYRCCGVRGAPQAESNRAAVDQ